MPSSTIPSPGNELPAEGERRMIITKMVLENFKSYAGPREIGPFHKSFTSVVGPNGSGKSNVIDAMLFVFGFKAKKMRQGKLSELIHHSAMYPDLESASVSVHFVDIIDIPGDDFKVIPGTEYVVMRNVTKSGKSQYYVNDKPSNFTEVTDALKKRGIDLDHKRFLILQGEVESISQMKPKAQNEHEDGLLEYLEDIIGTSGYKQPIEEAGKKVEELNEQRGEKLNRVKIVEKEKDSLEGKKAEAMEFLVQENELTQERSKLYQIYVSEATENVAVAEKNMQAGKAKLVAHAESSASLVAENAEMEKEYRQISKDHEDLAKVTKEAKSEFGASEREYIKLQENHKHIKEKIKKQKKANEKDSVASREQNNAIQNCKADLEKLGKELEKLTKSLVVEEKEYETIRDSLKGETQGFQVEIEKKQTDLAPWLEKKAKIQAAIDVAQSELELLTEKAHSTENALKGLKEKQATAKSSLVERKKVLEAMQKERADLTKATEKSKKTLEQLKAKEPEVTTTVKICREKLDEAKSSLQNVSNRGKVLSSLLKQRDSGRIRGIYGRLGDLGTIKDKYDVAISTACPALDNIVVDTTETGQQCIEYLRKNQLGRSTFIVLDKLNASTPTPETPESAPRLFDLVKAKEEKFLPAFYNALRDTLVANDLEQANRIAFGKQRFRVVTLDGKLIDKSGTMSGGGNRIVKGGMSSVAVADIKPEEIQVMEKESEARGLELKQIQEQQKTLIAEIETLTQRLSTCDTELAKCEMDVNSLEQQLIGFQSQEKELKSKGASVDDKDIQRMKQLEGEVSEKNKEMEKLNKSTQTIEDAIKVLQNKIMEVGGIRLKSQKSKLDGIKESIENGNDKTTRLQVQMKTSEKSVAKVNTQLEQAEKEIKDMELQLKDLEAKIEEKTTIAAAVHEKCEQAEKLMEKKQDELEKMKGAFEKIQKKVQKLQAIEVGIKSEVDTETRGFEENKKKLAQWTSKLSVLKVQDLKHLGEKTEVLKVFSKEEIRELDKEKIQSSIVILEEKLKEAKPNLSVIEQYLQLEKDYLGRVEELDEITKQRDVSKGQFDDLRKKRLEEFMEGFSQITQKLKEMYQMITLGGNAELELVDSLDPFSEGIIFSVMPPKKSWKNIANLSGGEKTLSSLALVFALHHYKPTPLYVMDEIDAALDFRNVSIVANYIKERTKNAQFVIISLRNNMFELADRLVGIYKTDSCTKSITIDPKEISVVAQ